MAIDVFDLTDEEVKRTEQKFVKSKKCWEWVAYRQQNGYGQVRIRGVAHPAHRVVYLMFNKLANISKKDIDHLCRNRGCVNPKHLEPVSRQTNLLRGIGPDKSHDRIITRTHCLHGHEYTKENTYWVKSKYRDKTRQCRQCKRDIDRRRYRRNKK